MIVLTIREAQKTLFEILLNQTSRWAFFLKQKLKIFVNKNFSVLGLEKITNCSLYFNLPRTNQKLLEIYSLVRQHFVQRMTRDGYHRHWYVKHSNCLDCMLPFVCVFKTEASFRKHETEHKKKGHLKVEFQQTFKHRQKKVFETVQIHCA